MGRIGREALGAREQRVADTASRRHLSLGGRKWRGDSVERLGAVWCLDVAERASFGVAAGLRQGDSWSTIVEPRAHRALLAGDRYETFALSVRWSGRGDRAGSRRPRRRRCTAEEGGSDGGCRQ